MVRRRQGRTRRTVDDEVAQPFLKLGIADEQDMMVSPCPL